MITTTNKDIKEYKHEPFTDFTLEENNNEFKKALEVVQAELGKDYPLVIGGEAITTTEKLYPLTQPIKKKWSVVFLKQIKH